MQGELLWCVSNVFFPEIVQINDNSYGRDRHYAVLVRSPGHSAAVKQINDQASLLLLFVPEGDLHLVLLLSQHIKGTEMDY